MGVRSSILKIALATLGSFLHSSTASAITLQYLSPQSESSQLLNASAFVAQGQVSKIGLNGNSIVETYHNGNELTEGQINFFWSNGKKQPFSLTYDGSMVQYTVGTETLIANITGSIRDIVIYTEASQSGSNVLLDSLKLKDSSMNLFVSSVSATATQGGQSLFGIYGITGDFTLTGNAMLSWVDFPQNPGNISYQIRVGNVESQSSFPIKNPVKVINEKPAKSVPEPNTVLSLLLSTIGIAFYRRRLA